MPVASPRQRQNKPAGFRPFSGVPRPRVLRYCAIGKRPQARRRKFPRFPRGPGSRCTPSFFYVKRAAPICLRQPTAPATEGFVVLALNEAFLWGKPRIWLGLVDLSRTQSGIFFGRAILARKWLAKITKTRQNENEHFQTMTNRDDS